MKRLIAAAILLSCAAVTAVAGESWPVDRWDPPFDYTGKPQPSAYVPVETARKPWRICASYPHLKDSYWLSVNYGMVEQARRAGVKLKVVEAGGYPNLERQKAQIRDCARGADAVIVGTVSYDGLTPLIEDLSKRMPVIAAVNDINSTGIAAKSGVSWVSMGAAIGDSFERLNGVQVTQIDAEATSKYLLRGNDQDEAFTTIDVLVAEWRKRVAPKS